MQKIPSIELPVQLPKPSVLKSHGQNEQNYEPEFWDFQYDSYRYLKDIPDDKLEERYRNIHRNFCLLVRPEHHVIPINCFLSSWYWYRKEYQTRYEFSLRNLPLPLPFPCPRGNFTAPVRSNGPNSCNILFRYGNSKFMETFVNKGEIRISLASVYKDGAKLDPKTDDELNKHRYIPKHHAWIKTKEGKQIPIISDVHETCSTKNYYNLSMSTDYEPQMFKEFCYDSCVIIKDPDQFIVRLKNSTKQLLPNWYFSHNPIEYFDPYEPYMNQHIDTIMYKDFLFSYQMEYRIFWHPQQDNASVKEKYIVVQIGSLEDICELYKIE